MRNPKEFLVLHFIFGVLSSIEYNSYIGIRLDFFNAHVLCLHVSWKYLFAADFAKRSKIRRFRRKFYGSGLALEPSLPLKTMCLWICKYCNLDIKASSEIQQRWFCNGGWYLLHSNVHFDKVNYTNSYSLKVLSWARFFYVGTLLKN